jgi:Fe-S-cluster-containing hydrogenase component 2
MEKHIEVRMEKCTGCRLCELACSAVKTGAFNPRQSRIKVCLVGIPEIPVPIILDTCDYCFGNPACTQFCLPKAIEWKEMETRPPRPRVEDAKRIAEEWLQSVSK